ncbi:Helicase associated domain protein [Streptomyces sp. CHA1]|uniref:DEAD/DEAH box helicase n=1 Tax=unclassified Streptomyces TaxID=2593676 RepID=UPI001BFC60E6|nr:MULTISPECIES: DEAD/DEAH box helicase [unclassified Streptomyces]MBT3161112.1 Helicase associated domain protein [Streptomyces sp. G11C]MCO6704593.1 Helicase associated domain protein [Streptomyces sp. CHB9.2]MCO6710933.1 Helicase associated domain protein [Streptomyces sp. CHA3]MCO6716740.1 Helicase associated domain protein [Streptomyces sp. CHB19.2]MCO6722882.1 Helicase associated domain protein [Streptomyces sp. Vc714c-19]
MAVKLRDHQIEAVAAIVRGFDIPPGGIPWNGLRGQVHAACGTGKTIMAAASARRLVPRGRVLVLVPTLDLLAQTVRAWHEAGHKGPAVAVCSLQDDPELWSLKVRSTTNPIQLALWHGSGPVTIYATYASLGVLAEAFEGVYGQKLDPVDLAVVDEAHRTSGSMGKAWADIHDQTVIPAYRRLYLTATPRIWEERLNREVAEGVRDPLPREMAASMDDETVFGPVLYKLSLASAVSRGLLARYQIIVLELQDPVVTPERLMGEERHTEEVRGQRLGALQAALLHTMAQHDLSTCITFHHRTIEAQAYAEGLERVAAKLHADQPETYPKRIWADWLCGEHVPERRREVLGSFGSTAQRAVLSNCRVLGEGVDIRSVDSVALLDPKGAPHDIVQAIGRALRQKPGQGKLASLIVPVFLQPGEQPEDMFTSGSYRPLVKVLEGLRAHDEEAVELLAIPQEPQKDVAQPSVNIGVAPEDGEEESRLLLRFAAPRDPVMVADWVSFNVIDTERQDWARGWAKLKTYVERVGNARVPYGHREGATPLGQWVAEQRRAYAAGQMNGQRARRLEQLGMVWSLADERFQENLEAAKAYYEQHWTLCAPRPATMLDRPVGQWLSNLRRPGALDGHPEWKTALEAVDEDWNPSWPAEWQRHYAALRELVRDEEGQAEVLPGVTVHGMDIGKWLARQQKPAVWQALTDGQRERLEQLGITPLAPEPEAPARPSTTPVGAFERGVAALAQYKAREGSVTVPRAHVERLEDGTEVKLGVWIMNQKSRRAKLTADKLAALAVLGLEWAREG